MRLALALLAAVTAGAVALPARGDSNAYSFVQVTEKEFTLTLSRQSVRAGSVSLEVVNYGMDNHDLAIRAVKPGARTIRFKQLSPRGRGEKVLRLPAGRYALWCTLADHKARGMRATLVVRK